MAPTRVREAPYRMVAAVLVLLVMVALIATTRGWMDWSGDDALYLMNARNIAEGVPYGHTLYLHNALNAIHPAAPPAGFPLLLAPLYALAGPDWVDFKLACVAALGLFLLVFAALAGEWLPKVWALLALGLIGLHPFTWQLKETIPPEFAFMFFAYGALWLTDRCLTGDESRVRRLCMIGAGACLAAAYLTRPVGIVLFPAVVLASLWQTRKVLNAGLFAAVLGFALAWCVSHFVRPDLGTYVSYLDTFGWQSLAANLKAYNVAVRYFLENHIYARTFLGVGLVVFVCGVALAGFIVRACHRLTAFEWFTLGYGALLLIYPVSIEPDRYSYPLWPLILLYALVGCEWLGGRFGGWLRYAPGSVLVVVLIINFAITYQGIERRAPIDKTRAMAADAAYGYIASELPKEAVVIARLPTVVALISKRRSATWPYRADDLQFRAYMHSIHSQYLLHDTDYSLQHYGKADELAAFVSHNADRLQLIYSRGPFSLYRLKS